MAVKTSKYVPNPEGGGWDTTIAGTGNRWDDIRFGGIISSENLR